MPRPNRPKRDLSKQAGNPTHTIQQHYQELMDIQDPQMCAQKVIELVTPLVGSGMSNDNLAKLKMELARATQRGIGNVRAYLTNYLLKGSGLGVEDNQILVMANMLTEDADVNIELTPKQEELRTLVEQFGYNVVVLENPDFDSFDDDDDDDDDYQEIEHDGQPDDYTELSDFEQADEYFNHGDFGPADPYE